MSTTISRLYGSFADAREAVRNLEAAGLPHKDISIVASNADGHHDASHGKVDRDGDGVDDRAEDAAKGAGIGAALGGGVGLLTGLGLLAIPGVGPVVAAGWLAATAAGAAAGAAAGGATGGIIGALTEAGVSKSDAEVYAEGVRRGGALVTARVPEGERARYEAIINRAAVNVQERGAAYRKAGWTGYNPKAAPYTADQVRAEREQTIPVVEENLTVGKRQVERGGVRLSSHIVEEPVSKQVNLREEHVSVERRPVNKPVGDAGDLLNERSIEMTETAEEAVVAKDAVVREEVGLRKDVEEKTADIKDTVRRTKVDVQDMRTGRKAP